MAEAEVAKRGRPTDQVKTKLSRLTVEEKKLIEYMRIWKVSVNYVARALDNIMQLEGHKRNFVDYIERGM